MFDKKQRKREIEESYNKGILVGASLGSLVGCIVGGLVGIFIAPDSGKNTLNKLQNNANGFKDSVQNDFLSMKKRINQGIDEEE